MLQQIDITNRAQPFLPALSLRLTRQSVIDPFQVRTIEGLGPVKANITSTPFGVYDGEALAGKSTGKRNIVLSLALNPNWSTRIQAMADLRTQLYKYFTPTSDVRLLFSNSHMDDVWIDGVVEDIVPNQFSKDPEVQVSILCLRPEFISSEVKLITGETNAGISQTQTYFGQLPTGVNLKVLPSPELGAYAGPVTLRISRETLESVGDLQVGYAEIDPDNYLELNTVVGEKYVRQINTAGAGSVENLLSQIGQGSGWPHFMPGQNHVMVDADVGGQIWELRYSPKYGGI